MKREILTFVLFLVLAMLMWLGHALQSVRNAHVPVLIEYTGKPGTIGLGGHLPDTVMIEVRDAGARLNAYYRDPLHLTIDLRTYIHGEKGTIKVPSDVLRRSISDILQGTSRLIDTRPEQITCPYFTEQEKSVVVAFAGEISPAQEFQLVGKPTLSTRTVKIFGQDKKLSTIDTVYTERLVRKEISDTLSLRAALVLPQGVRAERDSVEVRIIAERFTEKRFSLPIRVIGVPEGMDIRLFPPQVKANVRVGMSHFARVKETDLQAVCRYTPDRKDKLDVEIRYTNPYITDAWVYPGVVEFLLENAKE